MEYLFLLIILVQRYQINFDLIFLIIYSTSNLLMYLTKNLLYFLIQFQLFCFYLELDVLKSISDVLLKLKCPRLLTNFNLFY